MPEPIAALRRRGANGNGAPATPTAEPETPAEAEASTPETTKHLRLDELDALISAKTAARDEERAKQRTLFDKKPRDKSESPTIDKAINASSAKQESLTREIAHLRAERLALWAAGARLRHLATQAQRVEALFAVRSAFEILRSARANAQRIINLGTIAGSRIELPVLPGADLERAVDNLLRKEEAL